MMIDYYKLYINISMTTPNIKYCLPPNKPPTEPPPWARASSSSEYPNGQFFGSFQSFGVDNNGNTVCKLIPDVSSCFIDPLIPSVQHYVNVAKGINHFKLGVGAFQNQIFTRPFNPLVAKLIPKGRQSNKQGFLVFR